VSNAQTASTYDLLIIGGGLVGASLAAALYQMSLKVAVVEAVPFGNRSQPSFDDRVTAVSWGSRRIFESMGLWSGIAPEATPIRHIHISDRGRLGATRMHAEEARVEALGYVVPNRVLGRVLGERLQSAGNVTLFAPAKLQSFTPAAETVSAVIEAGGPQALSARLLVAADGARSEVRRQLGVGERIWDYRQTAVICNLSVERPQTDTAYERFTDSGPLALLPLGGDRYALIWTVSTERAPEVLDMDDATFLTAAEGRFGARLGRFLQAGKRQSYPLSLVKAESQCSGRVVIIGNAAHSLHPIAGQGFNLSLRDVALLAEVLAQGDDPGDAARLQAYVDARHRDQLSMALFTDGLSRVFANPLAMVAYARNAGLLALELLPGARQMLMRHNMGLAGRLPRLARGLPL